MSLFRKSSTLASLRSVSKGADADGVRGSDGEGVLEHAMVEIPSSFLSSLSPFACYMFQGNRNVFISRRSDGSGEVASVHFASFYSLVSFRDGNFLMKEF